MVLVSCLGRWAILASAALVFGVGWWLRPAFPDLGDAATWQRLVLPGQLSHSHAELEDDCGACHRAVTGVEDVSCIACHANNERLLTWPEMLFHASIDRCGACHVEHQGRDAEISAMDHGLLASAALQAAVRSSEPEVAATATQLEAMHADGKGRQGAEGLLRCEGCHARKDVHDALFGTGCGDCHETTRWNIPAYAHPPGRSQDCAQCHRAPPDHFGGHFEKMGSRGVKQCAMCHQPPSWLDIGHHSRFDN